MSGSEGSPGNLFHNGTRRANNQLEEQVGKMMLTFWGRVSWDLQGVTGYLKQVCHEVVTESTGMCLERCQLRMIFTFSDD